MLLCWHFVLHTDSKTKKHTDSMSKKQYESNLGYVCALYWPHYKNTSLQTDSSMGFSLSYAWNSNLMLYLTEHLFHMHSHTVCRIISFRNFTFLFNWIFSISHTLKKWESVLYYGSVFAHISFLILNTICTLCVIVNMLPYGLNTCYRKRKSLYLSLLNLCLKRDT